MKINPRVNFHFFISYLRTNVCKGKFADAEAVEAAAVFGAAGTICKEHGIISKMDGYIAITAFRIIFENHGFTECFTSVRACY